MYQQLMAFGYDDFALKFSRETSTPAELIQHYNNKGVFFSKNGDFINAIDEYAKALKLMPKSTEIYRIKYNMALAHINLKNYDHVVLATSLLEECLAVNPEFDKAQEKLTLASANLKSVKN